MDKQNSCMLDDRIHLTGCEITKKILENSIDGNIGIYC